MIKIKIVVDSFGGDFAPASVIEGAILAKKKFKNLDIIFAGNEKLIKSCSLKLGLSISDFEIIDAKDEISAEEDASKILKEKNESSMAVGLKALNRSDVDAFLTAGSTGALAVGACFFNNRIKGVKRAALCPTIPTTTGNLLLIDAGANLLCREDVLFQFGLMGDIFAKNILNIKNPKIGLTNVGAESKKGTPAHQKAFELLKECPTINFIGNVEPRYLLFGMCDVAVADGLSGNMILKTLEGTAKFLFELLKETFQTNIKTKIAAILIKKQLQNIKQRLDYKNHGGAIFLGLEKPIVKAHGNSNPTTIENAIHFTVRCVQKNIISKISNNI